MGIQGDSLRGRCQAKASSLNACISPRLGPVSQRGLYLGGCMSLAGMCVPLESLMI